MLQHSISKESGTREAPPSVTAHYAFGRAWIAQALALAVHVTDEALSGFLDYYNPSLIAIKQRVPWLPLPTFTFDTWIAGLTTGIILLLCLTPFVYRGSRWIGIVALPLGVLMTLNGIAHITTSIYAGRLLPGVYSSPLLICCSLWLLTARKSTRI
jgi:hypothetical protein